MRVTQEHEEKEYKTKEQPKKLNRYIEATASPEPVVKYVRERENTACFLRSILKLIHYFTNIQ